MIKILDNPILRGKVNLLRDKSTPSYMLRQILEELTCLSIPLLIDSIPLYKRQIETPVSLDTFEFVDEKEFILVPILRAGLPMLNGALRVFPNANVGFVAIKRNESTLESKMYYSRIPNLENKDVIILDPMLATGGTLDLAVREIEKGKPRKIYSLHIVASPEGIKKWENSYVTVSVICVDKALNQKGYIVPGVGDIGDRLFSS